jgi:transposase
MARYKHYDYGQLARVAVDFERQIVPETFEYAVHKLIDEKFDLSLFDACYKNDNTGAPAYDPAILLKIILCAYSKGVTSSRRISELCRENVIFMALAAHSVPHFTTIADFIASRDTQIGRLFRDVLLVCDEASLIGRQMFAVDGVKLSPDSFVTYVPDRSGRHRLGSCWTTEPHDTEIIPPA